jgi:hypothetical protein
VPVFGIFIGDRRAIERAVDEASEDVVPDEGGRNVDADNK